MMSDFSLEKLKISERLTEVETSMKIFIVENGRQHDDIKELLTKYGDNIFGNGKPGLNTRMDRMETIAEIRKWILIVFGGAITTLVIQRIWTIFIKG